MPPKNTRIYSAIAPIYNEIMKDVDYEDWADFIDAIIQEHRPEAVSLLELACGTGQIAMYLEELECYDITATDLSEEMLEIGRRIADFREMNITWKQQDFFNITLEQQYDVVMALFDSVNYIRKEEQMLQFFENVAKVMHPDSIF
ncbi:MAG: class I SAM-dependent methyltransferase, partial [Cyclonatronaceae bacterium]